MSSKPSAKLSRPPLGGIGISAEPDEIDPIRQYGLSKGFLPTDPEPTATATASPQPVEAPQELPTAAPPPTPSVIVRPAPTRPWQAMLPDYLVEALRQAAAREGTAQKVIMLKALRQAGFQINDIDLQDLRRR